LSVPIPPNGTRYLIPKSIPWLKKNSYTRGEVILWGGGVIHIFKNKLKLSHQNVCALNAFVFLCGNLLQ